MTSDRPKLGFTEELDNFDPEIWKPKSSKRTVSVPQKEQTASLAEASGFRSREPKSVPKSQRRHRTGRNTQFNIKADPDVIKRFINIADAQGWVFGEALEYAVDLLEQKFNSV